MIFIDLKNISIVGRIGGFCVLDKDDEILQKITEKSSGATCSSISKNVRQYKL